MQEMERWVDGPASGRGLRRRQQAMRLLVGLAAVIVAAVGSGCGEDESEGSAAAALPKGYPSKAVTLISPFGHGSTNDQVARLLADNLRKETGQTVTVTNVEGASGMTGTLRAIKAPADGYTLWLDSQSTSASLAASFKKLPFTLDERTHISQLATQYQFFVVPANSKFETLKDAMESAKSNPEDFSWAAGAAGSAPMYAQLQLFNAAGVEVNKTKRIVFPTGLAAATAAIATGQVMFGIAAGPQLASLLAAKKIKVIGVAAEERAKDHPDVPTAIEQGYPGVTLDIFTALAGPPDLPDPIVAYWRKLVQKWGSAPEIQKNATDNFLVIATDRDGPQVRSYIDEQYKGLLPLAEASGVRK